MRLTVLTYPSLGELVTVEVTASIDLEDGSEGPLRFWGRTAKVPHDVEIDTVRDLLAYTGEQLIALAYEPEPPA